MARCDRLSNIIIFERAPTLRDAGKLCVRSFRLFERRLLARFGDTPIALIDQQWAEAAERELYACARQSTRIRNFWTPLISMLNRAHSNGLCPKIGLTRPKEDAATPLRYFSAAGAQTILDNSAPHLARQLRFVLCTGAYPGEVFKLCWNSFNPKNGAVTLPSSDRPITALLPSSLRDDIARHASREFIFGYGEKNLGYAEKENTGGQNKTAMRTAADAAGVARFTLTEFRQTWAVWFIALRGYENLLYAARWASDRSAARYKAIPKETLADLREAILSGKYEVAELFRCTSWPDLEEG